MWPGRTLLGLVLVCLVGTSLSVILTGRGSKAKVIRPAKTVSVPVHRNREHGRRSATPTSENCTEHWFTQRIDHLTAEIPPLGSVYFQQRYYVYSNYWSHRTVIKDGQPHTHRGPIFFYTGNEADVTLYVNATGLMWEHAQEFGALLVFAEHRFYGESMPFGHESQNYKQFLSSEQALADYTTLIFDLKQRYHCETSPVVAFGGSYGGMLASWLRMKYPHVVDGAISASAPIWSFLGLDPEVDPNSFADIVTADATAKGGCADACADNVRATWAFMKDLSDSSEGRSYLQETFKLCDPLATAEDVYTLAYWIQTAWSYMAMGDFPYPSNYILMGNGELPAYPVCVACEYLADPQLQSNAQKLLPALAAAVGVYYNNTQDISCYDFTGSVNEETEYDEYMWNYQYCTELMMPSSTNGKTDMFWDAPWSTSATVEWCQDTFGITPRLNWAAIEYGGKRLQYASNIVFSNGVLDPWAGTGVTQNFSATVEAVLIEGGAHHLDLMFSHPDDPDSVKWARNVELSHIRRWIEQAYVYNGL